MPNKPKSEPNGPLQTPSNPVTPAEKRRQPRVPSNQQLWREGQPEPGSVVAVNISLGGMFIVEEEASQVGDQFHVSFVDDGQEIAFDLEVMWKGSATDDGPEGAGTRIVRFSAGQEAYERIVQEKLREQTSTTVPKPTTEPPEPTSGPRRSPSRS